MLCVTKYRGKKNLFYAPDHVLQGLDMIFECFFASPGDRIGCIGFSSYKSFVHFQEAGFLQCLQVGGQVAVSHLQQLLQVVEAEILVHHHAAHYTQPYAVVENFIKTCYGIVDWHFLLLSYSGFAFVFPPHDKAINNVQHTKAKGPEVKPISQKLCRQ